MSESENQVDAQDPSAPDEASSSTSSTKDERKNPHGAARRRGVVWGLIVVLIGVAVGATVGWGSQVPIYRSQGSSAREPSSCLKMRTNVSSANGSSSSGDRFLLSSLLLLVADGLARNNPKFAAQQTQTSRRSE